MKIRSVTVSDVITQREAFALLFRQCLEGNYAVSDMDALVEKKLESLLSHLNAKDAIVLGAFENEELLGFTWAYPFTRVEEPVMHIAYTSVLPGCQGQGIGAKLTLELEGYARAGGVKRLEMYVSKENEPSIAMHKRIGYYVHEFVMTKPVEG